MEKKSVKKIRVLKDGPYLVSGSLPLEKEIMVIGADGDPSIVKS